MRYLSHLAARGDLGQPYHFRSCRLQDWGTRGLGWRQVKKLSGTGELGDMLSHRIDFAHLLVGPMKRIVANMKIIHPIRGGQPNDLDDCVSILADFKNGATGVLESSKLASGRNESWRSLDYVEINGSERSFVFITGEWNKLQTGKVGGPGLETIEVPKEFWKLPGSPRDVTQGDPLVTFRYDQAWEFVDSIRNQRPCSPDFHDGARSQAVMDAAVQSSETRQWVEI
jgi:predicted dehydrogenase